MDELIAAGTRLRSSDDKRSGVVLSLLGQGGQGAVYKVEYAGRALALKWYHEAYLEVDRGLQDRLRRAIDRGAPDSRFLWPIELVRIDGRPSFGYLMPLRATSCVSMSALVAPPKDRVILPLQKRLRLCLNIARSFFALHAKGFCYQDVNFGNIFLFEGTADVLICDNDNVSIDGGPASVYGTKRFMAPEVVRRESLPNTRTDLYSMAVLFHYIILGWHPLEGAREHAIELMNADHELKIYGTEPLYIFDRNDASNGPVPSYHGPIVKRWQSLATELQELFHRSFGRGLTDPYRRVVESEWLSVFESLQYTVFECPECGFEHMATADRTERSRAWHCLHCGASQAHPALLKAGRKCCVLQPERVVPLSFVSDQPVRDWDSLGIIVRHPTLDNTLGIRNLTELDWVVTPPDSTSFAVKPGETILVMDGLRIGAGSVTALVLG